MPSILKMSNAGGMSSLTRYPNMVAGSSYGAVVPIATYTFSNSTSTGGGFSNIPQGYQDLMLVFNYSTTVSLAPAITFNGGGQTYSLSYLYGTGSSAVSGRLTNYPFGLISALACGTSTPNIAVVHILNYANTSTNKTALIRNAMDKNGSGSVDLTALLTQTTSAISSLSISTANGGYFFNSGSTLALYGIKASAA